MVLHITWRQCIYNRATAYTEGVLQKSQGTVYTLGGLHCRRTLYTVGYLMYQWGTVYGSPLLNSSNLNENTI